MEGVNAVPVAGNTGNGVNVAEGPQQNQGLDQQIRDVRRQIKDLPPSASQGGEGSDELKKLIELLEKLIAQKSQGAQGDQGAQNGQGGQAGGQGQIKFPESQGSGEIKI
ncbi:hypothetical protein SAMN04490182_0451 [Pseudomonas cedrina]|uniref:Type III secretion protein n=2 Tax=Pseudomonas cedrina TaxID=651740 RepID=A0A1V2JXT3_PSECE|nr:hypothetical protein [Pseudomonas cedrina]ONH49646.1 hypothetical protein BLL36_28705 [Pseudomonas cedrina subsp. cedrina]SDR98080.1 hypothetical protein SAMN04490182_0451 [Pseudomonas cedrina]